MKNDGVDIANGPVVWNFGVVNRCEKDLDLVLIEIKDATKE